VTKAWAYSLLLAFFCVTQLFADTVILKDGTSYEGECQIHTVNFTDLQGVQYQFPAQDVQSIAFSDSKDTVALRNGKSYSGHFAGITPISFQDAQGIKYQFPTTAIDAIVLNRASSVPSISTNALVIPVGTEFPVRINETIDSTKSYEGETFSAVITENVLDSSGKLAVPSGSEAELIVRHLSGGGAIHSPEVVLDLYSVTVGKNQYGVISSNVKETNRKGVGTNKRTAENVGGGSALGALMGGIFGGGKGAGIGALAGAGGGLITQVFTRGKEVHVPAESVLKFRLEKTLILEPAH
jgi:hypothetical protein